MIRIGKANESIIDKGIRLCKIFVRSRGDVHTDKYTAPHGDDSCPVAGADVIHGQTVANEKVILGVVNLHQKALPGEKRIFATDAAGNLVFDLYIRNDGTCEFGGIGDNLVKYTPLDTGLQNWKTAINLELTKIQAAIAALGGTYAKLDTTVDVTGAKIDNIKTS